MEFYKNGIHYSEGMEKAVLGAILLERTAFGRVASILHEDVFYHFAHQRFFRVFKKMWESSIAIDHETALLQIHRELGATEYDGIPLAFWLIGCSRDVVSTANLEQHAITLQLLYVDRELMRITQGGIELTGDTQSRVKKLQDELSKLNEARTVDDWLDMPQVLINLQNHIDTVRGKQTIGITTGFNSIDRLTGGLTPGQLVIIGARPSVGKSAFAGKMILKAAKAGHKVGVISLEMDNTQIAGRITALEGDVDFWRIYRAKFDDQEQSDRMYRIMLDMSDLPIRISDKTQVNISDIKAKVVKLIHKKQLDVLFVDYLQLMETEGKGSNRDQELGKISRGLKLLAMEYKIPIVALCQLNRQSEARTDKRPRLSDLRESGNLEQDADGVILIHRDWMSGILVDEHGNSTEDKANAMIVKWRNGELADVPLLWDGPKMKFHEPEFMDKLF